MREDVAALSGSDIDLRYRRLRDILAALDGAAIAFSGGVDSTLLLKVAHDVLGDRAFGVTISSCLVPRSEAADARAFCEAEGIRLVTCHCDILGVPGVRENPPDRCYLCKRALFERIGEVADAEGSATICDGSNLDDRGDYRPGERALRELGVMSPLVLAGFGKADVRGLSRCLGLPTWDKPSAACLASRFAYGERLDEPRLAMVDAAEDFLRGLGFGQVRVRVHGPVARIEVPVGDLHRVMEADERERMDGYLRGLGFDYVTVDLGGYRMGSMDEALRRRDTMTESEEPDVR